MNFSCQEEYDHYMGAQGEAEAEAEANAQFDPLYEQREYLKSAIERLGLQQLPFMFYSPIAALMDEWATMKTSPSPYKEGVEELAYSEPEARQLCANAMLEGYMNPEISPSRYFPQWWAKNRFKAAKGNTEGGEHYCKYRTEAARIAGIFHGTLRGLLLWDLPSELKDRLTAMLHDSTPPAH